MKEELNFTANNDVAGPMVSDFFQKILNRWYWFALSTLLGLVIGILFIKYSPDRYEVACTVLVHEEDKASLASTLFEDQSFTGFGNRNVSNQIGVLRSFSLNLRAMQNLNWDISIYEKQLLGKVDRYLNEPFKVQKNGGYTQIEMIPIYITPVSNGVFSINVDSKVPIGGVVRNVKLSGEARFGEPFENEFFNFTILRNEGSSLEIGQEYILIFNNLSQLTREYQERLEVSLVDDESNLISVKLEGGQPLRDINYLNELTKVYIDFGLEEKNRVADNTLRFISNQLIGITDSLQSASQDFTNFRSRNRIVDLGQEANIVVSNLEEIQSEEARINMRLEYYNNLKRYLNDASQMKELVAPSVVGITDPALNTLVLRLSDLSSQKEVLSYTVQEKNPNLVSLVNEIQYTQKILQENIDNLLNNTHVELANLNERKQRVNSQLSRLPKTEQDLVNIKRTFDLNNDLYTFLLRKRAEVGIARASNSPDARILDTARFDSAKEVGRSKIQIIIMSLLLGLGFPFIVIIVADYFDSKIGSINEVERLSSMSIAGNIVSNKFKSELPVVQHQNSSVTESFRTLRTNLYYLTNKSDKKVFAVHSARVGEGKSFVSANLACILALNNKRVLLVEADMKKPRLHAIFRLNRDIGLSTFLSGKATFDEIIVPTKIKGLSFVSAGSASLYSSELLSDGLFEKFISSARAQFDYVVLDSVPSDILSDGVIIGQYSDVNLFVLRIGYSKREQLKSINKLADDGVISNLALILNDVSISLTRKQLKEYGYHN